MHHPYHVPETKLRRIPRFHSFIIEKKKCQFPIPFPRGFPPRIPTKRGSAPRTVPRALTASHPAYNGRVNRASPRRVAPPRRLCHGVAHCRRRDRPHKRERVSIIQTEQGEKINSTTTPMVARGRCQEGLRGNRGAVEGRGRGIPEGWQESGGPLTHPGTRAYTRTLRFLPHILNEHTAATYLRAHGD